MSGLPCPAELWERFSSRLDELLELPEGERWRFLNALPPADAELLPYLRAVLPAPSPTATTWPDALPERGAEQGGWRWGDVDDYLAAPGGAALGLPFALDPSTARHDGVGTWNDEPQVGDEVGPYRLERALGRGGMGVVWLASRRDGAYQRQVALKLPHLHLLGGSARGRFRRERDILASLTHPNIARFYDAGLAANEQPFLALEHVEGEPITSWCANQRVTLPGRLMLMVQVMAAVGHAHAHLVVHRDLKPSNVFVDSSGQVKLLDFGIAKLLVDEATETTYLADARRTELTEIGTRVATPEYAPPEQLRGEAVTVATDVYALGVVLYELLAGVRPFTTPDGGSPLAAFLTPRGEAPALHSLVSADHAAELGVALETLRRQLAGDLEAIVGKALAPRPEDRYTSVATFSADLERVLRHEPVTARPLPRLAQLGRFVRRHQLGSGLALAILLVGATGVAAVWRQAVATDRAARRAAATRDYLVGVFAVSDPRVAAAGPRGATSSRILLDRAAAGLAERAADDPRLLAELLGLTATLYSHLDEVIAARQLTERQRAVISSFAEPRDAEWRVAQVFAAELALRADDLPAAAGLLATLAWSRDRGPSAATWRRAVAAVQSAATSDRQALRRVLAEAVELAKRDLPVARL